jgi:hypothetical protein
MRYQSSPPSPCRALVILCIEPEVKD